MSSTFMDRCSCCFKTTITAYNIDNNDSRKRRRRRYDYYTNIQLLLVPVVKLVLCLYIPLSVVNGTNIKCNTTTDCQRILQRNTSICLVETGFCSNPFFHGGCLAQQHEKKMKQLQEQQQEQEQNSDNSTNSTTTTTTSNNNIDKERTFKKRTCSSIDRILHPESIINGDCTIETEQIILQYNEIRFLGLNWESVFFETWILQIILSELLGTPTSVETSYINKSIDFYNIHSKFDYGKPYDYSAFRTASGLSSLSTSPALSLSSSKQKQRSNNNNGGDCTSIVESQLQNISLLQDNDYISCAQVGLEFWIGQKEYLHQLQNEDIIVPPNALGALGEAGWYTPLFTVQNDPSILNFIGLQGEKNRQKLASMFLRPTTWYEYCTEVSINNCTIPDVYSQRQPIHMYSNDTTLQNSEGLRYFMQGNYTGYFRNTSENDCLQNPTTCTGHIADLPCGWTSFVQQQTYHLNIALKSSGKEEGSYGYTYNQLVDIWAAANATKSNVIMMWWTPEPLVQQYMGSDAQFLRITLPPATQECSENRIQLKDRCNTNIPLPHVGSSLGSCDDEPTLLYKVYIKKLHDTLYDTAQNDAQRNPGYDTIRNFQITGLQLNSIFEKWLNSSNHVSIVSDLGTSMNDHWGYNPRDAVCEWVYDNIELLETFIPRSYPRIVVPNNTTNLKFFTPFGYVATIMATLSMILLCCVSILIYTRRKRKVIIIAQFEFLTFFLFGLLLAQSSAFVLISTTTNITCMLIPWLTNLGITFELIPLLVKVAAINRLMSAAIKLKRVRVSRQHMLGIVFGIVLLTIIYLLCWTILEPPQRNTAYSLVASIAPSSTSSTTNTSTSTGTKDQDEQNIIESYDYCSYETSVWHLIALIWRSILLFSAVVLAFQSRNSPININESKTIALMVYAKFICLILVFILYILSQQTQLLVQTQLYESLIQSIDVICICFIYFIPKLTITDEALAKASVMYSTFKQPHHHQHQFSYHQNTNNNNNPTASTIPNTFNHQYNPEEGILNSRASTVTFGNVSSTGTACGGNGNGNGLRERSNSDVGTSSNPTIIRPLNDVSTTTTTTTTTPPVAATTDFIIESTPTTTTRRANVQSNAMSNENNYHNRFSHYSSDTSENDDLSDFSESFMVLVDAAKKRRQNELAMLETQKYKSTGSIVVKHNNTKNTKHTKSTRRLFADTKTSNKFLSTSNLTWNHHHRDSSTGIAHGVDGTSTGTANNHGTDVNTQRWGTKLQKGTSLFFRRGSLDNYFPNTNNSNNNKNNNTNRHSIGHTDKVEEGFDSQSRSNENNTAANNNNSNDSEIVNTSIDAAAVIVSNNGGSNREGGDGGGSRSVDHDDEDDDEYQYRHNQRKLNTVTEADYESSRDFNDDSINQLIGLDDIEDEIQREDDEKVETLEK